MGDVTRISDGSEGRIDDDNNAWTQAAVAICVVLIVATACLLVLHWAGVL